MAETMEYKCPACGGAMEFNSELQKMKCPYCDTVMEMDEYQKLLEKENKEDKKEKEWEHSGSNEWTEEEKKGMKVYICESCGGEIIADENTGATFCPYCGNKVAMKGQFSGDLRPDYVIPFKMDKKQAKAAYFEHLKGKSFLPKIFKDENHIDEIKGIYVPFWLFDVEARGTVTYDAQKVKIWRSGDTEYTQREYYKILREGSMKFEHIPSDGSEKMDDTLMESIEPFDFKEAVSFQTAYLAGYLADRYDVSMEERVKRARERVKQSTEDAFRETVKGYDVVTTNHSNVSMKEGSYKYALYPVWLLNTNWNGQKYVFAMNGQTGKMVGNLPVDKKAFYRYVFSRTVIFTAIFSAFAYLFL